MRSVNLSGPMLIAAAFGTYEAVLRHLATGQGVGVLLVAGACGLVGLTVWCWEH